MEGNEDDRKINDQPLVDYSVLKPTKATHDQFLNKIFTVAMRFHLDAVSQIIRLSVKGDLRSNEKKIGSKSLQKELLDNTHEVVFFLSDPFLIDTKYVLSDILGMKNWTSIIDNMHTKTVHLIGMSAFVTGCVLLGKVDDLTVLSEAVSRHLNRLLSAGQVETILNKVKPFRARVTKIIDECYGPLIRGYANMICRAPRVVQDVAAILNIRSIDTAEEWEAIMLESISGAVTDANPANQRVIKLVELVAKLEKIFYSAEYQSSNRDEQITARKRVSQLIREYYAEQSVAKSLSKYGIISSVDTISSLVTECIRIGTEPHLERSDSELISDLKTKLLNMMEGSRTLAIDIIYPSFAAKVESVLNLLDPTSKLAIRELISRSTFSSSYPEAWQGAVRIKGMLYEACFAKTMQLPFATETSKLSLQEIIYCLFPNKWKLFLGRSSQKHSIRDLKPDFFIPHIQTRFAPQTIATEGKSLAQIMSQFYGVSGTEETGKMTDENPILNWLRVTSNLDVKIETILKKTEEARGRKVKKISVKGYPEEMLSQKSNDQVGLLIIEVGYQTSSERKTIVDTKKWSSAANILASCGINCTVVSLSESTSEMKEDSWLDNVFSKPLSQAIGYLFSRLTEAMPPNLTSILVGELSSQELRLLSTENRVKTCPVTRGDLLECHIQNKERIFERPNGTELPEPLQKKFVKCLVQGSLIKQVDAVAVKDELLKSAAKIIHAVDKSSLRLNKITYASGAQLYLSYMTGELSSCIERGKICSELKYSATSCLSMRKKLQAAIDSDSSTRIREAVSETLQALEEFNHRKNLHQSPILMHHCGLNEQGFATLPQVWRLIDTLSGESVDLHNSAKLTVKTQVGRTNIDKLASITLPGRVAKQKKVKSTIRLILETFSSMSPDGFIKNESGLLLSSHREILIKSGCVSPSKEGVEKRFYTDETAADQNKTQTSTLSSDKRAKPLIQSVLTKLDSVLKATDCLTEESIEVLGGLRQDLRDVAVSQDDKGFHLINKLCPGSLIKGDGLLNSLHTLLFDSIHVDPIRTFFVKRDKKSKDMSSKFEFETDYPVVTDTILDDHLRICKGLTECLPRGACASFVPESIFEHVTECCQATLPIGISWDLCKRVLFLLGRLKLGKALKCYSYVCQAFLIAVSDMTSGGVKVVKIPELNMNIVMMVGANKTTNCSCVLTDLSFNNLTGRFFLNRNVATLGQSLLACVCTNLVQTIQTQSCTQVMLRPNHLLVELISAKMQEQQIKMDRFVRACVRQGYSMNTSDDIYGRNILPWESHSFKSDEERQVNLIVAHLCCLCYILVPSVIRSSRKDDKVLQMVRHPYMLSISRFGFPSKLGDKMNECRRNTCSIILSKYLAVVCSLNVQFAQQKLDQWSRYDKRPTENTVSISQFPYMCRADRQFTSDMYFCHWYNKEMDSFSEGCIRVTNAAFEKVFDWEVESSQAIKEYNSVNRQIQKATIKKSEGGGRHINKELKHLNKRLRVLNMKICCFYGLKNVNTNNVDSELLLIKKLPRTETSKSKTVTFEPAGNSLQVESAEKSGEQEVSPSLSDNEGEGEDRDNKITKENLVLALNQLSNVSAESEWAKGSGHHLKRQDSRQALSSRTVDSERTHIERTFYEREFPKLMRPGTSAGTSSLGSSGSHKDGSQVSYDGGSLSGSSLKTIRQLGIRLSPEDVRQLSYHTVDLKYIMQAVEFVCANQFPFSCGVPEVIQAFTELSKEIYTDINIFRALKSKDNNEQISAISETTSILASSLHSLDVKSYFRTIISKQSMKIAKVLSKSLRKTSSTDEKSKSFHKLLNLLITSPLEESEERIKAVNEALKELKASSRLSWRDILKSDLESIAMTDDASPIFRATKTLWKDIKVLNKAHYTSSRKECSKLLQTVEVVQAGLKGKTITTEKDSVAYFKTNSKNFTDSWVRISNMVLKEAAINSKYSDCATLEIDKVNVPVGLVDDISSLGEMVRETSIQIEEYQEFEKKYPDSADPDRLAKIIANERTMLTKFSETIKVLIMLCLAVTMYNNFSIGSNEMSKYILKANRELIKQTMNLEEAEWFLDNKEVDSLFKTKSLDDYSSKLVNLLYTVADPSKFLIKLMSSISNDLLSEPISTELHSFIIKLYFGVKEPFSAQVTSTFKKVTCANDLTRAIKEVISRTDSRPLQLDYLTTVTDTVTGSLAVVRRILGRTSKGISLPRSVRSKVIYQMYELTVLLKSTNVQEMAFQLGLDKTHIFYGSLAPKAQIGDDRDLIVQERKTKVVVHANEMLCKSLMQSSVKNDGLTNPRLKEDILGLAAADMKSAKNNHGADHGNGMKMFYKSYQVIGDCSKWGPIHCTSFFSSVMQQLMRNVEGWCYFSMMVMYKSLYKEIEISIASIEKVLNSLLMDQQFRSEVMPCFEEKNTEKFAEIISKHVKRIWKGNEIVAQMITHYFLKGYASIKSFSHMGQGIHHRMSSLLASLCHYVIDQIMSEYLSSRLRPLLAKISHGGSSDDFSKVIRISGIVSDAEFEILESMIDNVIQDALKLMMGLMRSCQMMVSVKTCVSNFAAEFYSEFCFLDSVSPPTLKFISNQLINHSVSSPNSLYQGTLVESQQAMYMGVPMATNLMFCVFKQTLFVENSGTFYKRWARTVFQSFPIMGRFFLPSYARLVSGSSSQDEIQVLISSCEKIINTMHDRNRSGLSGQSGKSPNISSDSVTHSETYGSSEGGTSEYTSQSGAPTVSNSDHILIRAKAARNDSNADSITDTVDSSVSFDTAVTFDKSAILNLVIWRYYRNQDVQNGGVGSSDKFSKILEVSDTGTALKDPFLQILPESVVYQVEKLNEMKSKIAQSRSSDQDDSELPEVKVASLLIGSTTVTDDYSTEVGRLQQALRSKQVIRGLAGGMKEISLPIHRQMLRGYFFHNSTPLTGVRHWVRRDNSKYTTGDSKLVLGTSRVRIEEFLNKLFTCEIVDSEEMEAHLLNLGLDPMQVLPGCNSDVEASLFNIPVDLIEVELLPEEEQNESESESQSQVSDGDPQYSKERLNYIVINHSKLVLYLNYLQGIRDEIISQPYKELIGLEHKEVSSTRAAGSRQISKTALHYGGDRSRLANRVALLVAVHLSLKAVMSMKPRGVDASRLNNDLATLQAQNPFLITWLDTQVKKIGRTPRPDEENIAKEERDGREKVIKGLDISLVASECLTYCRLIEQTNKPPVKVFMFQPDNKQDIVTNYQLLVQSSTIENSILTLESGLLPSTQDSQVYAVLGVISVIAWQEWSENEKYIVLKAFLQTPMSVLISVAKKLKGKCRWAEHVSDLSIGTDNSTFGDFLIRKTQYYRTFRNKDKEEAVSELVQAVIGQTSLLASTPIGKGRPEVNTYRSGNNTNFTVSVEAGTASGLIAGGKVYLIIQGKPEQVLPSIEQVVLSEVGIDVLRNDSSVTRKQFFQMLPAASSDPAEYGGNIRYVILKKEGTYKTVESLSRLTSDQKLDARLLTVTAIPQAPVHSNIQESQKSIDVRWFRTRVEVGVSTVALKVTLPQSWVDLQVNVKRLLGESVEKKLSDKISRPSVWVSRASLKVEESVGKETMALFHLIRYHLTEVAIVRSETNVGAGSVLMRNYNPDKQITKPPEQFSERIAAREIAGDTREAREERSTTTTQLREILLTASGGSSLVIPLHYLLDITVSDIIGLEYEGLSSRRVSDGERWTAIYSDHRDYQQSDHSLTALARLLKQEYSRLTNMLGFSCKLGGVEESRMRALATIISDSRSEWQIVKFCFLLATSIVEFMCLDALGSVKKITRSLSGLLVRTFGTAVVKEPGIAGMSLSKTADATTLSLFWHLSNSDGEATVAQATNRILTALGPIAPSIMRSGYATLSKENEEHISGKAKYCLNIKLQPILRTDIGSRLIGWVNTRIKDHSDGISVLEQIFTLLVSLIWVSDEDSDKLPRCAQQLINQEVLTGSSRMNLGFGQSNKDDDMILRKIMERVLAAGEEPSEEAQSEGHVSDEEIDYELADSII